LINNINNFDTTKKRDKDKISEEINVEDNCDDKKSSSKSELDEKEHLNLSVDKKEIINDNLIMLNNNKEDLNNISEEKKEIDDINIKYPITNKEQHDVEQDVLITEIYYKESNNKKSLSNNIIASNITKEEHKTHMIDQDNDNYINKLELKTFGSFLKDNGKKDSIYIIFRIK